MKACFDCGTSTDSPSGFCGPCITRRATESRAAQGLPPTVDDPKVLARIERIVRGVAA